MKRLKISLLVVLVVATGIALLIFKLKDFKRNGPMIYGVSFNTEYAYYLGFDIKNIFNKILDEWNFRYIRLSAQWDLIEKNKGQYDWQDLDWLMDAAAARHANIMLAVGHKTPRWPECHAPTWTEPAGTEQFKKDLENFITLVVQRYQHHPALETWQVENEPFLKFGTCGTSSRADLKTEVVLVKKLDPAHRVIVTDSGELSLWLHTAKAADLFGTTLYRVVWNKMFGYINYNWVPAFVYKARLWLNGRDANTAYITELQAEPWIPDANLIDTPLSEQYKSMSLEQLQKNIIFAEKTGMARAYLWGAEWWYWLETRGETGIPNYIKQMKK